MKISSSQRFAVIVRASCGYRANSATGIVRTRHAAARSATVVVALTHARECKGKVLPEGAKGAVVFEYRDGAGYEVEFDEPFHCILTVERDDIRPV